MERREGRCNERLNLNLKFLAFVPGKPNAPQADVGHTGRSLQNFDCMYPEGTHRLM